MLKDAIPKLARVGVLRGFSTSPVLKESRPAAVALKLNLEESTQADPNGLESAFQIAKQKQVDAIMPITATCFFAARKRIVELVGKYRLPAIYPQKEYVDEGGLMAYGRTIDCTVATLIMSTKYSKERNLPICRCSRPRSLNLSLT